MAKVGIGPEYKVIHAVYILFVLACILPCVDGGPRLPPSDLDFDPYSGWHFGLAILLFGWGSGGNYSVPWSANVFLAIGLPFLAFRRYRTAAALGFIASALGMTTWTMNWFSR